MSSRYWFYILRFSLKHPRHTWQHILKGIEDGYLDPPKSETLNKESQ